MGFFKKLIGVAVGAGLVFVGFLRWDPTLIRMGIGVIAVSVSALLVSALAPQIKQRLQEQSVMVRSAVEPQKILYGEDNLSGVVPLFDTSGDDNEFLWFVIAIVEHEIDSYTTLWLDDVAIDISSEIDGSGFVTKADFVDADSNMLVKTKFYVGTDSQTADSDLVAAFSDWTTDHKGEGVAYFWVRLELDRSDGGTDPENPEANVWSRGYPRDISVTAKGALVYDPRLDSTQVIFDVPPSLNFGSGSHREDTPSTWEWSENSALCRTDYLRSSRFGPGYTADEIIWTTVAPSADIAEEQVTLPGSPATFQDRYTLNGVVDVSDSPKAVLESMQSADHGVTVFSPAGLEILIGAWDASSWTIDKTWIAGAYSYTSAISADSTYNAVRGQYLSKASDYTLIEFQPRTASAYETEDGGTRVWQDVVLPFTNEEFLAQRIAIIELKKSRQQKVVQLECNFRAELVEPYQVITLDLPGIDNETYRVMGKETTTDGITKLSLREEVESDWTYDVPDLAEPPVIPGIIRGDATVPPPTGLAATSTPDGIRLNWTLPPGKALIQHIELWANTSNGRASASLITSEPGESFMHVLPVGSDRWYWILARGINGLVSTWEPVSAFAGVAGTAGGENIVYYIKPLDGTAIHNHAGTLRIEAHKIEGGIDAVLSAGTIKLFDPGDSDLGYTAELDSGDINGSIIITMKDGAGGPALDTISLVDIADGEAGGDAVYGYIEASNGLAWSRAPNSGAWTPSGLTTQLDVTFVQGGDDVARIARLITLTESDGKLNVTTVEHTGGNLNIGRVGVANSGTNSTALTSKYTYGFSGDTAVVAETVSSAAGGDDGDTGPGGDDGLDGLTIEVSPAQFGISADSDGNVVSAGLVNSVTTIKFFEGDTAFNHTGTTPGQGEFRITGRSYSPSGFSGGSKTGTGTDTANFAVIGSWSDTSAIVGYIDYAISYRRLAGASPDAVTIRQPITITRAGSGGTGGGMVKINKTNPVAISLTPADATIKWQLDNDGNEKESINLAALSTIGAWKLSGVVGDYNVRATEISGTFIAGTFNTWQSLGTDRFWTVERTNVGTTFGVMVIEIELDATNVTILTQIVTLEAEESA